MEDLEYGFYDCECCGSPKGSYCADEHSECVNCFKYTEVGWAKTKHYFLSEEKKKQLEDLKRKAEEEKRRREEII